MKHVTLVSRRPARGQTAICSGIGSDYQALLCFLVEVLQTVFPSLIDSKTPTQT